MAMTRSRNCRLHRTIPRIMVGYLLPVSVYSSAEGNGGQDSRRGRHTVRRRACLTKYFTYARMHAAWKKRHRHPDSDLWWFVRTAMPAVPALQGGRAGVTKSGFGNDMLCSCEAARGNVHVTFGEERVGISRFSEKSFYPF